MNSHRRLFLGDRHDFVTLFFSLPPSNRKASIEGRFTRSRTISETSEMIPAQGGSRLAARDGD